MVTRRKRQRTKLDLEAEILRLRSEVSTLHRRNRGLELEVDTLKGSLELRASYRASACADSQEDTDEKPPADRQESPAHNDSPGNDSQESE